MHQPCSVHFQINYPDQSCSSFHKNPPPTHSIATFNGLARGLTASANRLIGSAVIDDSLSPLNTGKRVTFSSEGIHFNYSAGLQLLSTCTELQPRRAVGNSMFMYRAESLAISYGNKTKFGSGSKNLYIHLFPTLRHR